jgi:ADP-ribosylglycohydrolase
MSERLQMPDRLAGAVWGHLVGDAVGVPYEFRAAGDIGEVRFGAKGTHHQPPGTWSDDGALMLALLDSLLTAGFDADDQGSRAIDWHRHGAYTPDGTVFDIGNATRAALDVIGRGTPAESAGPTHERASGNGSLMRILPIALVMRDIPEAELVDLAHRASRVTHGTARAQVACALYVLIARRLLQGNFGREAALVDARAVLRSIYGAAPLDTDRLAALDHLEGYAERGGRGRVWDSFWSAWDAFAGADSYRQTIERAIAYGEDTDTTAAIAGGLAGLRWGMAGIPSDWLAGMRGREIVQPLIDRLLATDGWLTSTGNPLRVNWVDLRSVPGLATATGRVGMTFLPGKRHEGGVAGKHWRDLETDAQRLRADLDTDTFLVLVEDAELVTFGVPEFIDVLTRHGIGVLRHPMPDGGTPADHVAFGATLMDVRARVDAGQTVVVACRGGLGRTGTTVACLLREAGLDGDAAIVATRAARTKTIETLAQEQFVRAWAPSAPVVGSVE